MKTYTLITLALATSSTLAGFSVGPHHFTGNTKQHRALAGRAVIPSTVAGNGSSGFVLKKRVNLSKRKVLGTGDSATAPANLAKGTFDAAAGCTVWHTVAPGEVCLGLIDKSSASFTMALFHTYNPALSDDCDNLEVGTAYCVDNAPVSTATDVAVATPPKVAAVVSASPIAKTTKADTSPDDDENCDDDGEDDEESDDDETCEDDGEDDDEPDSAAPAAGNARTASSPAAVVKSAPVVSKAAPVSTAPKASPSPASSNDNSNNEDSSNSSGSNQSLVSTLTGQATYYMQNGNKGACGNAAQDSDYVVALYTSTYGSGGNCGKTVSITNTANGKTATAKVADMCPGCSGSPNNIDLSEGLFKFLSNGNLGAGVLPIKWGIQQ